MKLAASQKKVITEENCYYLVAQGSVELFIQDKLQPGQTARMRFVNTYAAPCLLVVPSSDARSNFVLAAVENAAIQVMQPEEVSALAGPQALSAPLERFVWQGLPYKETILPELLPIAYVENKPMQNAVSGQLVASRDAVRWVVADNRGLRLFNKYEIPPGCICPLTRKIWYYVEAQTCFEVIDTQTAICRVGSFYTDLLKFWSVIYAIDADGHHAQIADAIRQVYANAANTQGNREYAQTHLLALLDPVVHKNEVFTHPDPLMGCLELIGRYEKIIFKEPKATRDKTNALKEILSASRIRSRKTVLPEGWFRHEGGAFLAFSAGKQPIALIPKSHGGYLAYDYVEKTVEKITLANEARFRGEVYSFFTPFAEGKQTATSLLTFGLGFIKKELAYFFLIGISGAVLALFIPIIMGYIFDHVIPNSSINELGQILLLLLTVALSKGLLDFAQELSVLRLEGKLNYKLQAAVWDRLLSLKVRFFHRFSAGDLAERSIGIDKIRGILSGTVLTALISFIFSIFYFLLLFYYSIKLALVALLLGLTIMIFTVMMSYYAFNHIKIIRYLEVVLSGFLFQIISGISKIRVTDSQERVFSQWVGRYVIQKKHYLGKRNINVAGEVFSSFFPVFSAAVIFWQVHKLLLSGDANFTVGNYISFNNAFLYFQLALLQMSMATVPLLTIKPVFDTFKPIIEAESEYAAGDENPGELEGNITVADLSFRYRDDQPLILDNINFKIYQGEYVALVGGSGSGKSTLLRLLLRFEDPLRGQILYDNKDVSKLDISRVRQQMGVVIQNGKLMPGTLLYNIVGNSGLDEAAAWEAARMAGCATEIEHLEHKMYTEIVPGDPMLSGGQIQRIIIARAFARKAKILLFDEATSALDNVTQKIVSDSISRMNVTRVVIAHRLSSIMNAHRILVLDKGRLVESGTYEELMRKGGYFADLAKRQFL